MCTMMMNLITNKERVLPTWSKRSSKRLSKYSSTSRDLSSVHNENIENEGSVQLNSSNNSLTEAKIPMSKLSFMSASHEFDMHVDIPKKSRNPNK